VTGSGACARACARACYAGATIPPQFQGGPADSAGPGLIRTLWFWRRAASSALRAGAAQAGPTDPRDVSSPAWSTSPRSPRRPRARRPVLGAAATPAALMLKSKHMQGIVSSVNNYVSTG
jgi:hypothetical protein